VVCPYSTLNTSLFYSVVSAERPSLSGGVLAFAARITIMSRNCSVTYSGSGFLLFWSRSKSLQSRSGYCSVVISQLRLYCPLIAFQTNELARIFCSSKKESLEDFMAI